MQADIQAAVKDAYKDSAFEEAAPRPVPMLMGKGVIVLTYACNLKCTYCYAGAEVFSRPKTMSFAEACSAVEFLGSLGISTFTLLGGEPTVFPHLTDLVRFSAARGLAPWIVTNGTRFANAAFGRALFDAGLKGGCVSLHGSGTPESHDEITRIPGSYRTVMEVMRLAVINSWPLYPMLTVMDSCYERVLGVIQPLREIGCRMIYINYGLPNIVKRLDTGVDSSPEALAALTERLFRSQRELNVRFVFNREKNKIPLCHFNHELLKEMFDEDVIGTGCEAAEGNTVVVEPGGSILGCSHWVKHPLLNIYEDFSALKRIPLERFWHLWRTGAPARYRESLRFFPFEKCGDCGWRKDRKCFGGCKVWQAAGALSRAFEFADQSTHSEQGRSLPSRY